MLPDDPTRPMVEPRSSANSVDVLLEAVRVKNSSVLSPVSRLAVTPPATVQLLHGVEPIVNKLRGDATDRLLHTPPEGIIDEARGRSPAGGGQMPARIPGVGVGPAWEFIDYAPQLAHQLGREVGS
jgi:hypothetical protein